MYNIPSLTPQLSEPRGWTHFPPAGGPASVPEKKMALISHFEIIFWFFAPITKCTFPLTCPTEKVVGVAFSHALPPHSLNIVDKTKHTLFASSSIGTGCSFANITFWLTSVNHCEKQCNNNKKSVESLQNHFMQQYLITCSAVYGWRVGRECDSTKKWQW